MGHVAGVESQERAVVSEVREIKGSQNRQGLVGHCKDFGCDSEGSQEGAQSKRWTRSDFRFGRIALASVLGTDLRKKVCF